MRIEEFGDGKEMKMEVKKRVDGMIMKVEDNKEILKNMRMMVKVLGKNVKGLKLSKESVEKDIR